MLLRTVELGIEDRVLSALRTDVHAMCVGPVTARPLVRLGVPTSAPEGMATIRALAHRPGTVVSRNELLNALPGSGSDTHAVETA
jgi:uroporphyrinogen-III synthase